jgi:multiple sugar transport system permease protein
LNTKVPGRPIFRTLFYLPAILPSVAVSILWIMLLNSQGGVVDVALQALHLPAIPWLTSPSWALWSLILLSVWGIGPMVVIFLAGLQDVPRELYEAARIDGARGLRVVQHVTIPMISPVILFNLIIGMISALQVFAQPFIIFSGSTNAGGGPLNSALMYSVQLYFVAFQQFQMGYASAMAWVLFVIVMAMSLAALLVSRWLVHYE